MKALAVEQEFDYLSNEMKESIINEIIQSIPAENSASITINFSALTFDTLHAELDGLLDLK